MKAILCADKNWAIGKDNRLLVSIPADMRFFRQTTSGHVVVMGRKTLESFPNGQPLKNRTNIVLTHNPDYKADGAIVVHSKSELLKELEKYDSDDVYVIGGSAIYSLLLPYCDTVYVTKVNFAYQADTWFTNLDLMPEWEMTDESEEETYFDIEYTFRTYRRKYHVGKPE
ncbi:MAG: dihydrofolate reductase [Eubacterium sp.]|nr:dihydrofolate reductase [Eubacterium sp.]